MTILVRAVAGLRTGPRAFRWLQRLTVVHSPGPRPVPVRVTVTVLPAPHPAIEPPVTVHAVITDAPVNARKPPPW